MIGNIEDTYTFKTFPKNWILDVDNSEMRLKELSDFYSKHYGIWSSKNPYGRKGNISLSPERIKDWLSSDSTELWTVRLQDELVGYAIVLRGKTGSNKNVIWVTQFVIHNDHRNKGIGKHLLFRVWGFSSFFAWGLLTANPYAVRALEKATRRRCDPERIKRNTQQLYNFGIQNVSYVNNTTQRDISNILSTINTEFFVDHSEIPEMLTNITTNEKPWLLGKVEEGWEWFAFTFNDQAPIELTTEEIELMLKASDKITKEAYGRMPMNKTSQKWSAYTTFEVNYIIEKCKIQKDYTILDVGCGMGRHTLEFSKKGYNITGIDYSKELIAFARKKAEEESLKTTFKVTDISDLSSKTLEPLSFDCILCLYDVIGSYADRLKNIEMIRKMSSLLKKRGRIIISVMNYELTKSRAINWFDIEESTSELLSLPASNTMEKTGNIFNPKYYLIDKKTNVVYRKEVFSSGKRYPTELIVRDRRYSMSEITQIFKDLNFNILEQRFVNAGWKESFSNTDKKAKEILLICEKA